MNNTTTQICHKLEELEKFCTSLSRYNGEQNQQEFKQQQQIQQAVDVIRFKAKEETTKNTITATTLQSASI